MFCPAAPGPLLVLGRLCVNHELCDVRAEKVAEAIGKQRTFEGGIRGRRGIT